VALATCRPPYPTPSSATRNWVRFACVTCYALHASHATKCYVFRGFLEILASRRFSRKLIMGNDLDRNCPDLASPARSWRNSITNKGFAVFLPIELMLSKGGSYWLGFATCRLRFRLRIATFPATYCYVSGYVSAIKRPGQAPSGIREGGWPTFALLTTVGPEPRPARSTPGEPDRAAHRQAFASLSYPTNRQVLRNPHVGRPGFLVSMSIHPRTALRHGRHAGLLLIPNCQRWSVRSRHT